MNQQQPYTPEEALAFIIDSKMSVNTYKTMSQELKQRGYQPYPPYYLVQQCKSMCYPKPEIQVSENEVSVSLQGLIDHTFERIIQTVDKSLTQYCTSQGFTQLKCLFEASWGFDGTTGQDKQKHSEEFDENSIFTTTFVPLRITHGNHIIWTNPCPQSYCTCRPIHIQYRKETSDLINSEKSYIESQIQDLNISFAYTSKNHLITASSNLTLCMIDGKVFKTITNTKSSLTCPICKVTAKHFNNLELVNSKPVDQSTLVYGLSPLHCWIRVLEFLLHLSYKKVVQNWRINKKTPEGKLVENRKN